jgi:hypothetical protein
MEPAPMDDTVVALDDLVKQTDEHLAKTDETYSAEFANNDLIL